MANEITANVSLSFAKGNVGTESLSIASRFTMNGANFVKKTQSIPTTAGGTALDVAGLSTLGMYFIKNNDATNFVTLLSAVSGTTFAKLKPGEAILGRFPSAITAPAALADTGACQLEYLILED